MTNTTETHTTLSGKVITIRTRKDGRMDKRSQDALLADLRLREAAIRATLNEYAETYSDGPIDEEVADRWNDLHDYASALEFDIRQAERNAAPVTWGSTAWLAANNID